MPTTTVYARREAAEGTTQIQRLIFGGVLERSRAVGVAVRKLR